MKTVTNGFSRMSEAVLDQQIAVIIRSITGNPLFAGLQKEIAAFNDKANAYKIICIKALNGGKDAIAARNALKVTVIQMLHEIGLLVSAIAMGDEMILAASGFPFTRTRQASPSLTLPPPPMVRAGVNNGELICKTEKQKGAKAITYMITDTPNDANSWKKVFWTKTTYTFTRLTGGTRYYIKVAILGARGQETISAPTCYIPQ
ncbi:MAG: fibronectin type III domain-containing protein [Bacteroidota bacterium]|nr:fibronectin type III domain-containing protein [Bacteroidota bacterium]